MVLVATRRHAGKAKGPGLTNPRAFLARILLVGYFRVAHTRILQSRISRAVFSTRALTFLSGSGVLRKLCLLPDKRR